MILSRSDARLVANHSVGMWTMLAMISVAFALFAQTAMAAPSQTVNIQSTDSTKGPDTSNRVKHPFPIFGRLPSLPSLCSKPLTMGMRSRCAAKTCEDLRKKEKEEKTEQETKPKDPRGYLTDQQAIEPHKPKENKSIGQKAKEAAGRAKEAAGKAAGKAKELLCKVPLPTCVCPDGLFEDTDSKNPEWRCKTKSACLGKPEGIERMPLPPPQGPPPMPQPQLPLPKPQPPVKAN